MARIVKVSRRQFVKVSAAAGTGLVLGVHLPSLAKEQAGSAAFSPNAWLSVDPEGAVTITVARSEMGQGVRTALPMIVAEELEADWSRVRVAPALADPKYGNMTTGGSTSVRQSFGPLRAAGAAAREMLTAAAAARWRVPASECRAESGKVTHAASKRSLSYGELAAAAARQPVPKKPALKDPKDFRLIGKSLPRLDTFDKVTGRAAFGIDVEVPGMRVAVLERCPAFGGTVGRVDDAEAKATPGVEQVIPLGDAVAVVARDSWSAMRGREALKVTWNEGPNGKADSASLWALLRKKLEERGEVARKEGDAEAVLKAAGRVVEAEYEAPLLAHATMEPMNATAHVQEGRAELWLPTQAPTMAQGAVAELLKIPKEKVIVHTTLLGGGFGRRAMPDFALEAALVSKRAGKPVKVVWSREDDMRHDFYRPLSLHRLRGALDGSGKIAAFEHRFASPSISEQLWPGSVKGLDDSAVDVAANFPYLIPNVLVEYVMANTFVPAGWWRSVYASQNAFATECFVDELAQAAQKDPIEFRLAMLPQGSRKRLVLQELAKMVEKAGAAGPSLGVACAQCFGSFAAQAAKVSVSGGHVKVEKVWAAVDCGQVINPDIVRAQVEGAVVYGLSGLMAQITVEKGRVAQGSFDDYPIPTLADAPHVEVSLVLDSWDKAKLGGIGEPGLPPLAPAVVNAASRVAGSRIRKLPMKV